MAIAPLFVTSIQEMRRAETIPETVANTIIIPDLAAFVKFRHKENAVEAEA